MDKKLLDLYTDYLMVSTSHTTATGMSKMLDNTISHDAITRFLSSNTYTPKDLWELVKPTVRNIETDDGVLICDDTIQEKPSMKDSELNCYHWDHSKGRTVKGINMLNILYHSQDINIPVTYDLIKKPTEYVDEKTGKTKRKSIQNKNEIFRSLLDASVNNTIKFKYILADIWFCSNENMKHIKLKKKKDFIFGTKSNRLIALSLNDKLQGKFLHISDLDMQTDTVLEVYIQGLPFPVLLFKKVFTNKDDSEGIMYLLSSDLTLDAASLYTIYQKRWNVEEYHKSLKSNASLGKSPARTVITQSNHVFSSIYAYFKFECLKMSSHLNHFALKSKIYIHALKYAFSQLQSLKADTHFNIPA